MRPGDRVRLTIEVVVEGYLGIDVSEACKALARKIPGQVGEIGYELLDRPLRVGTEVLGPFSDEPGVIRHIAQGIAAVEFPDDFRTIHLDDLCWAGAARHHRPGETRP